MLLQQGEARLEIRASPTPDDDFVGKIASGIPPPHINLEQDDALSLGL